MGKISQIFNFDNIGAKIKNFVKWSCWITILLIWIALPIVCIFLIADSWPAYTSLLAVIGAMVSSVLVWLGSWVIYAFGELTEDIHALRLGGKVKEKEKKNKQKGKPDNYTPDETESEPDDLGDFFQPGDFVNIHCPRCRASLSVLAGDTNTICPHCNTTINRGSKQQAKQSQKQDQQRPQKASGTQQLSPGDIEKAVSTYLQRKVSISEIRCCLVYVIPASSGQPLEMHLNLTVGKEEFTSLDLILFDYQKGGYYYEGKRLALDEPWLPASEIFSFDTALFQSFETCEDNSD